MIQHHIIQQQLVREYISRQAYEALSGVMPLFWEVGSEDAQEVAMPALGLD